MTAITVILAVVILAIAFKKELGSFLTSVREWFSSRKEKTEEDVKKRRKINLSPETKHFFTVMAGVLIIAGVIIGTFFLSLIILPDPVGYIIGGTLALAELIGIPCALM